MPTQESKDHPGNLEYFPDMKDIKISNIHTVVNVSLDQAVDITIDQFDDYDKVIELYQKIMDHTNNSGYTKLKDLCEHIVKADIFDKPITVDEIMYYSPTGSVSKIFTWYAEACIKIGLPDGTKIEDL